MKREVMICDICGNEFKETDGIRPDGYGGFTNLREKYPSTITYSFESGVITTCDLCLECSMRIHRYIRGLWWTSQQKHSLQ